MTSPFWYCAGYADKRQLRLRQRRVNADRDGALGSTFVRARGLGVGSVSVQMVFCTPTGTRFIDAAELEELTGEPVRSEYRIPGAGNPLPAADAVLACPLTFNSVNKFAHGHADNFAVGLLCEMTGYGVPVVVVPHCKPQLASHPAFGASLETLRGMGVRVLFDPDAPYERRLPPWREVVDALPVRAGAG